MATKPILPDVQKPMFGFDPDTLRPKLEDIYIGGNASPSAILDRLLDMTSRKRMASEAVAGKIREQQQQGVRSYAPNNNFSTSEELAHRLILSGINPDITDEAFPKRKEVVQKYFGPDLLYESVPYDLIKKEKESAAASDLAGAQITQRPSGGVVVRTPDKTFVTSRYGTGVNLPKSVGAKTFDGKPAAEYFTETAARQGQSNKFAAAVPTGFKDILGRPKYTGVSLVEEAMSKKKA